MSDRFGKLVSLETLRTTAQSRIDSSIARRSADIRKGFRISAKKTGPSVMVRELNGSIHLWNPSAEDLYGWSHDQAVGSVSHALLKTQFPCSLRTINHQLLRSGFWEGELVHTLRNGNKVKARSRWELQTDATGSSITVYEINQDLTPFPVLPAHFLPATFLVRAGFFCWRHIWWLLLCAVLSMLATLAALNSQTN